MLSDNYMKEAVNNVKTELKNAGKVLIGNVKGPMDSGYRLELDVSPELGPDQSNYYHNLIGVIRWTIK